MSKSQDLTWAQVAMAANTPMLTKAALVDGKLESGVLPSGQVVGRDRRPADRRRADRAHHGRGRGRPWPDSRERPCDGRQ